jgi:hypothetical protein
VLSTRGLTTDDTVKAVESAYLDPSNDVVSTRRFASDDIDSSTHGLALDEFGAASRDPVPTDPLLFAHDAEPVVRYHC